MAVVEELRCGVDYVNAFADQFASQLLKLPCEARRGWYQDVFSQLCDDSQAVTLVQLGSCEYEAMPSVQMEALLGQLLDEIGGGA